MPLPFQLCCISGLRPIGLLHVAVAIAIAVAIFVADSVAVTSTVAIAIAVAIAHRRHCCRWPLLLWSPSTIAAAISVALLSAITVAVALVVGHCRLPHRRPSQLPLQLAITVTMPSAIAKSCCLSAARIVFDQLKQRMLTLFCFVRTVGGILIEAGSMPRWWAAMANTSIGRWAASSERLVCELAGGWGAAGSKGWRRWLTMGGVVLFSCWGISHWQMAFVMMCWMW